MKWLLGFLCFFCPCIWANDVAQSKVLICGVGKNVAKAVPAITKSIEELGSHFADYRVIIYENNSIDKTAQLFQAWQKKNQKVCFYSEFLKARDLYAADGLRKLYRTEMIARARNIVLQAALDPQYDDFKYLIMMDLDFGKPLGIDGILSSFDFTEEWDAICANGIVQDREYWDWYAFRDIRYPFGPELYGVEWWMNLLTWRKEMRLMASDPFLPVISAFGGLAIYKRESMRDCSYSGIVTQDLDELMREIINNNDPRSQDAIEKYISIRDEVKGFFIPDCSLEWFADKWLGTNYPTVCEHVTFHASMIKNNRGKIFINPRMIMRYWECM